MQSNRSIPRATVIPVLAYPDVIQAAQWLCEAFGFTIRLTVGKHRVQLNIGDGAVILREKRLEEENAPLGLGHAVMVRIDDADGHCRRARESGARVTQEPVTYPYGERQYTAVDIAGHLWTFTQTIKDVHPMLWGGKPDRL
jgi:uncharacterized glyoxalase superfamily protein PhnB